ncbi:TfoX/Sxy family protein [Acuticoccus sp. M5D2P5]|uniref:TfoX/Sxy family protein n=1 Tax=Acuticoccus kalidii TaxID=2910977 RepID=UPI001F42FE10|nr:TfoX/Sxy family protein [Acuticoccus kalidii]MCF3932863.1 TfoX/Sxy family protein [Acuticoccus kalidii]
MNEDDLADLLGPHLAFATRRMFGGIGVFQDGEMFALVADGELYFKTDPINREAFVAAQSAPFVYETRARRVETSYWRLPEAAFEDTAMLAAYIDGALAAARRKRASKPGVASTKPKRTAGGTVKMRSTRTGGQGQAPSRPAKPRKES